MVNEQFLDRRARRANDDIWAELSFKSIKDRLVADNKSSRHEDFLKILLTQVVELADFCTGSRTVDDITAKYLWP